MKAIPAMTRGTEAVPAALLEAPAAPAHANHGHGGRHVQGAGDEGQLGIVPCLHHQPSHL